MSAPIIRVRRATVVLQLGAIPAGDGGGGTSNHAALTNLPWVDAAHTGPAYALAAWDDGAGAYALPATELAHDLLVCSTPEAMRATLGAEVAGAAAAAVAAIPSGAAAGTPSLRTLGTGATQAVAGDDARLSDARTPTAHAASHAEGGGDPLALASASLAGVVCARTLAAGIWWPNAVNGSNTSSSASAALTLYASPFVQETANEWDQIAAEPAVLAAGGLFKLQIFADAGGTLGGLIWDSGDLSSATTGFRSIAFSAGTWADTSYQNGNNLRIKPGQTVFLALLTNSTTATFRWIAAAAARPLRHSGTIGANQIFTKFVATYPSYVTQNPVLSTLTAGGGVVPEIKLRAA